MSHLPELLMIPLTILHRCLCGGVTILDTLFSAVENGTKNWLQEEFQITSVADSEQFWEFFYKKYHAKLNLPQKLVLNAGLNLFINNQFKRGLLWLAIGASASVYCLSPQASLAYTFGMAALGGVVSHISLSVLWLTYESMIVEQVVGASYPNQTPAATPPAIPVAHHPSAPVEGEIPLSALRTPPVGEGPVPTCTHEELNDPVASGNSSPRPNV